MNYLTSAILGLITFSLVGCAAQSKLTYSPLPEEGSEGVGFAFVVPRTVIKVDSVPDKNGGTDNATFTIVPVAYAEDGKTTLPRFLAVDSSSAAFSLTQTTISAVTYADELIISEIGTEVTDNRKDAIDTVIGVVALAGLLPAVANCSNTPLKPFVLDHVSLAPFVGPAPNNKCWGYSTKPTEANPIGMHPYPVTSLATAGQSVAWFPIPVCRSYHLTVFRCKDAACSVEGTVAFTTVLSVADGTQFRRVPLPAKGKISLHSDFCQADVTNDAVGTGGWGLLNQAISDVKATKK